MSQKTVMAVYDQRNDAKDAVQTLLEQGFRPQEVSLLSQAADEEASLAQYEPEHHSGAGGAATGSVVGGLAGLMLGLGLLTIPGVGAIVVAGPIATTLVGVVTGAVMGGLMGVLMDFGVPEPDAHLYSEALRRGGTIVAVTAPPERVEAVTETLGQFNAVDLAGRAEQWKEEGWTGFEPDVDPPHYPISQPLPISTPSL